MEKKTSSSAAPDDFNRINDEATAAIEKLPKYQAFYEWLVANGTRFPKLRYPVAFGPDSLIGVSAKAPIAPFEAFLLVPGRLLITADRVKSSALGPIIREHPELFESHYD